MGAYLELAFRLYVLAEVGSDGLIELVKHAHG